MLIFLDVDARSDLSEEYSYQDHSTPNEDGSEVLMTGIVGTLLDMR